MISKLEDVLDRFGNDFKELIKLKMVSADAIASGDLYDSITLTTVTLNSGHYEVVLRSADYINEAIEDGQKAGTIVSVNDILKWIEFKKIVPRPIGKLQDITKQDLAGLIVNKIYRVGTKDRKLITKTMDELIDIYRPLIREAILYDRTQGLHKMLTDEFIGYNNVTIKLV